MEPEITNYEPSDEEDLRRFFRTVFEGMGFDFDLDSKDRDLRDIPGEYQSGGGLFLVAKHQGQIIGTVALRRIAPDVCELKRFYVRVEHRRRGVGTRLLERAIAHARAHPTWRCIRLDTSSKSPAALSLFRKHGFVEIGRYNDDPFAEVFMELGTR
jgi:putative acetyltransferase